MSTGYIKTMIVFVALLITTSISEANNRCENLFDSSIFGTNQAAFKRYSQSFQAGSREIESVNIKGILANIAAIPLNTIGPLDCCSHLVMLPVMNATPRWLTFLLGITHIFEPTKTSTRNHPYRPAKTVEEAFNVLMSEKSQGQFNPQLIDEIGNLIQWEIDHQTLYDGQTQIEFRNK